MSLEGQEDHSLVTQRQVQVTNNCLFRFFGHFSLRLPEDPPAQYAESL